MAQFNAEQKELMSRRNQRRAARISEQRPLSFLDADAVIAGTTIKVQDAREGRFIGAVIPQDLQRQWVQGTGPAAKPNAPMASSLRNVAYALLSGADGWMFDGEDALGQITTMSLDNQRSLKLAIARDPLFLTVAEQVAGEMNTWARGFLGRDIINDWHKQLDFTTTIFRTRGLHLDDRHLRVDGASLSASIVDLTLYVVHNQQALRAAGSSIVLYLPKIQTAEEAAFWNKLLSALESSLHLEEGTIKVYVLVEQLEATFQLMEIRAALGLHFIGFNTGRWDYINSVSDALCWDASFINPNIEAITMTYGYMRHYEDRVRRAVNTPDKNGNYALWQGGMEPNIPVGSQQGVASSMERARAGAVREQQEGASGKWVAHWKMVHIIRPIWEDAFGNDDILYLMEDMATGEIRLSILWEWIHKGARLTEDDHKSGLKAGAVLTAEVFTRLLAEEYAKLLAAENRDVHQESKHTTLPIARAIAQAYVLNTAKLPWYIDLLNINLNNSDLTLAEQRIASYIKTFTKEGRRITENLDTLPA